MAKEEKLKKSGKKIYVEKEVSSVYSSLASSRGPISTVDEEKKENLKTQQSQEELLKDKGVNYLKKMEKS